MPDMKMRRLLLIGVLTGVILACVGLTLFITSPTFRVLDERIFWVRGTLIMALLILMPIFAYMLRLRRTARRVKRSTLVEQKEDLDQQLAEMVTPEGIRAIGGEQEAVTLDSGSPLREAQPPAQEERKA